MQKKTYFNFFLATLIFVLWMTVGAYYASAGDLTSTSFIIRDPVVGVGGGYATSGSFRLFESLDPVLIGVGSSGTFLGRYGFLYFQEEEGIIPPTPGGGGGGGLISVASCGTIADFNCDGKVDLLDLSILLFYTDKSGSRITPYDLSEDGQIDLMDISIMFYYWSQF